MCVFMWVTVWTFVKYKHVHVQVNIWACSYNHVILCKLKGEYVHVRINKSVGYVSDFVNMFMWVNEHVCVIGKVNDIYVCNYVS